MTASLDRRLGLVGAVAVGAGAMIGAGLFVVPGPAVAAAGGTTGVVVALLVAALVAGCNAHSSARLAMRHPVAGGAYVYGREQLSPFWGHLAGWSFVIGKISSCAVMALAVGAYAWPEHQRTVALVVLAAVTVVNLGGIQKSAVAGIVVVGIVLLAVVGVVVVLLLAGGATRTPADDLGGADAGGVLRAAALLFFAFAGYARLATLGEEVRDPSRTIPRAVAIAVLGVVSLYLVSTAALLHVLGPGRLADSSRPFATAVRAVGADGLVPVVVATAALAAGGALLSLVLGVSRTTLAMARDGHLPRRLATVGAVHRVPWVAELAVAAVVGAVVLLGDVVTSVAFSSFCVLVYYAIANASAMTLDDTRVTRPLAATGLVGCAVLVVVLPWTTIATGAAALALGALSYGVRRSRSIRS